MQYETVRLWCIGRCLPDGARLLKIKKEFNVSLDWLLTGQGKDIAEQLAEEDPETIE